MGRRLEARFFAGAMKGGTWPPVTHAMNPGSTRS